MSRFSSKLPYGVRRLFQLPANRDRLLREMAEELETHVAMRVEDLRRLGMSQAGAEAEARRRFGDSSEFRGFDASAATAAGEIVVNQALARCLWPDRDPIGARLRLGDRAGAEWLTVVGIADDVRMPGGAASVFFNLQMYRPSNIAPASAGSFVLRARGDLAAMRPLLTRAVERAGVGATLRDVVAAESTFEYAYRGPRFALWLFGAFALLAVALAAVGLFGIVAFAVARRTREIGIRVALGADPAALTRTILGQSLRLVAVGCALGLLGAFVAAQALRALVSR